jgi:hypothetical protein
MHAWWIFNRTAGEGAVAAQHFGWGSRADAGASISKFAGVDCRSDVDFSHALMRVVCFAEIGFANTSVFYGRDIVDRVHVEWGSFSLVAALKNLLHVALEDPLNQKFMLLSESGIPLYPAETLWVELMVEEKSRVNACELGVRPNLPLLLRQLSPE